MSMLPDDIAEYLGSAVDGLAYSETTAEGNVYVEGLPADPDRAVAVYSIASPEADSKLPYDPAAFQVIVRGEAADTRWVREMWYKIYSKLHGVRNYTLPGGTYVVFILATHSGPVNLGEDDDGRHQYSCDFRTEILNTTDERN